jgi:hypothetical protein
MDPDMVRQQEEAEEESRRLKLAPAVAPASTAAPPSPAPKPEPRIVPRTEETETVLAHVHMPGLPPVIPIKRKKRPTPPVDSGSRIGWFVALRISVYALIMATLGLLGGMTLGSKLGLAPMQSFLTGAGLGFLLGWQAAFASLRANREVSFIRALLRSISPALIVLGIMIVALLSAQNLASDLSNAMADGRFWMMAGAGALIALILSTLQTRKLRLR